MYNLQDNSNPWVAFLYFFLLVVFGSFFILNYFLAVFMESFSKAEQQIDKDKKLKIVESSDSERDPISPNVAAQKAKCLKKQSSP